MRAAEEERNAKALGRTEHNIGAQRARCLQQEQRKRVGGHGGQSAAGVQLLDDGGGVKDVALGTGVGDYRADEVLAHEAFAQVHDFYLKVNRAGALRGDGKHLRVQARIQHHAATLLDRAGHKPHGFRGGRGLVQQRSIRDGQSGQGLNHGLEVQQRFKTTLGDLWLIRGIGGVPSGIFQ